MNMNIIIPVSAIQAARKLLTRLHFERLKLPVLTHVLATIDAAGLTLAVSDLDHWLETRIPATINPTQPTQPTKPVKTDHGTARFLIPAAALAAAARGDKGGSVQFDCPGDPDPDHPVLKLTITCGKMPVESVYQPEPVAGFTERPVIQGRITTVPKETFQALRTVAGCASTDESRYVLNGVLFSPDNGGILIATDGQRLAGAAARFGGREFILPSVAVHVLGFQDFTGRDAAILQPEAADSPHVQFRSGPHTLIARTIEGNYPNYRCVMPGEFLADATIPETHRPALISWLRSLDGRSPTVRLTWAHPGRLTLTHWDCGTATATIQVPVTISGEGRPPVIAFRPRFLADALVIGSTLRLIDGISPGVATDPATGNYCLIMPCRFTEEAEDGAEMKPETSAPAGGNAPVPAIAA
jgi:DNA polymerase III sliding clamp (beta) subunit (PCNA family)